MAIAKAMQPSVLWEQARTLKLIQAFEIRCISVSDTEVPDIVNLR
jgi:hypothetical protein